MKAPTLRRRIAAAAFVLMSLSFGLSLSQVLPEPGSRTRSWWNEPRQSAGLAPDPEQFADTAVVQVLAAPTYGWRGVVALHPWIIYKRAGEKSYIRHDVVGWYSSQVVRRNFGLPDGHWYGSAPRLLADHRGAAAAAMIDDIETAVRTYPYAGEYRSWPGPNSNTFLAHIGREVPALKLDLPANSIGKDYRDIGHVVGISPTGSGLQITLLGLLGLSVGLQEGVEFNLLGLNFGIDLNRPALRLPFIGRIGMDDRIGGEPDVSL